MAPCESCGEAVDGDRASHLRWDRRYFPWRCALCPAKFTSHTDAELHFTAPLSRHSGVAPDYAEHLNPAIERDIAAIIQRVATYDPASDQETVGFLPDESMLELSADESVLEDSNVGIMDRILAPPPSDPLKIEEPPTDKPTESSPAPKEITPKLGAERSEDIVLPKKDQRGQAFKSILTDDSSPANTKRRSKRRKVLQSSVKVESEDSKEAQFLAVCRLCGRTVSLWTRETARRHALLYHNTDKELLKKGVKKTTEKKAKRTTTLLGKRTKLEVVSELMLQCFSQRELDAAWLQWRENSLKSRVANRKAKINRVLGSEGIE